MSEEKDLKTEEEKTLPDIDPSDNKSEPTEEDTSKTDVDLQAEKLRLEEELNKVREERDNYKQGMLSAKDEVKRLKPKEEQDEPKEDKSEQSESKKDEKSSGYSPEKEAIAQFERKHPSVKFQDIRGFYRGVRGKDTVADILDDLEEALDYRNFKQGNTSSFQGLNQDGGASEQPTSEQRKVTSKDVALADKYFGGDVDRYMKYKEENK